MALLSHKEVPLVEAAISRAEARSAGELVVALVRRSAGYSLPRVLLTATWSVALALGALHVWPEVPCTWVVLGQLPVAWLTWLGLGAPPLLRLVIGQAHAERAVRARALQMFAERGVHQTRDHSGLLIMISELEHRVVILGDQGIHAHIGAQGWDAHVRSIVEGIKGQRLGAALVQVIDQFGEVLAAKFPPRPDDVNELPNHVVRE